jgi:hypothetical protein
MSILRRSGAMCLAVASLWLVGCGSHSGADATASETVERPAMRRLTKTQYDNTVRDLLGISNHPAADFTEDEIIAGFAANSQLPVQGLQLDQYDEAAEDLAAQVVAAHLSDIVGCAPATDTGCLDSFIQSFGKRAFRRPVSPDELSRYHAAFLAEMATSDFPTAVGLVVRAMLQSPYFLYRVELGERGAIPGSDGAVPLSAYEVASRLSYFLWNTMPDAALFAAADAGQLGTQTEVEAMARRMLQDPKARDTISWFHDQWLGLQGLSVVYKDGDVFPTFTADLRDAMSAEADDFVNDVVLGSDGRLETLLSASYSFLRGPLYADYGLPAPADPTVTSRVELPPSQRAGVLTLSGLLSMLAHEDQTSIVFRGLLVREQLLCQPLPSPPADVNTALPMVDPHLTWRQQFEQHRADPVCAACHNQMDPIGDTFEEFDPIGRFRTVDSNSHPIDATGQLTGTGKIDGPVANAVDLAHKLSTADLVRRCVADQWFRYAFGHQEGASNMATIQRALDAFGASDYRITEMMVALTTSRAFRFRMAVAP